MTKMKLEALGETVIIKRDEADKQTESGILLPDTAQEKPVAGMVLAVGPGHYAESGKFIEMCVKTGMRVLFKAYVGQEIEFEGEQLLIVKQGDVVANIV